MNSFPFEPTSLFAKKYTQVRWGDDEHETSESERKKTHATPAQCSRNQPGRQWENTDCQLAHDQAS